MEFKFIIMINVNRVFVLDKNKKRLTPCRPDRARKFLRQNKATIFRRFPFTIILRYEVKNKSNVPVEVKYDPGSKTTGIVLTIKRHSKNGVIWSAELTHKGSYIKEKLDKRRIICRSRRNRKLDIEKLDF